MIPGPTVSPLPEMRRQSPRTWLGISDFCGDFSRQCHLCGSTKLRLAFHAGLKRRVAESQRVEEGLALRGCCFRVPFPFGAIQMLVDFQHHYTPPELMERGKGDGSASMQTAIQITGSIRYSPILPRMCG